MELTIDNLRRCFKQATEIGVRYVAVKVQMEGFENPEVIINEKANFEKKLAYYENAYNEDLTLKSFNGIKIIGFTWGSDFNMIEEDLMLKDEALDMCSV